MDMPINHFKRAILAGRPQIGIWCTLCSSMTMEIAAGAGFDWLVLDSEHTPAEPYQIMQQLQTAAAYPVSCVVRPPWNDPVLAKRILDVGAQTVLVPYVESAADAERAVASVRYPPRGVRGVAGSTRATRYGRVSGYFAGAAEELCLLVQIESAAGLDNLEAIAEVDGVDGVFIGPADLAANLGHGGDMANARVIEAIEGAIARIRACGKAAGILSFNDESTRRYLDLGATFVAVGVDTLLLARATSALAERFVVR